MMIGLSNSRSYGQEKPPLDGRDAGNVASNGSNFMKMPANVMTSECTQGIQSDLLEKNTDERYQHQLQDYRGAIIKS